MEGQSASVENKKELKEIKEESMYLKEKREDVKNGKEWKRI